MNTWNGVGHQSLSDNANDVLLGTGFCHVCCRRTEEGESKNIIFRSQFGKTISPYHR